MYACAYIQIATKLGLVIGTQIKSIGEMPRTIFRQKCQFKINKLKALKLRKIFSITIDNLIQTDLNWYVLMLLLLKKSHSIGSQRDLRSTHTQHDINKI